MRVLDPSPREAEPFTRITRRLAPPLFPSRSLPNSIASLQCAAFIEKSELTTGGSLPGYLRCLLPRRSPFPSSVIPSRGDDEGPPLWSDHPSSFTSSPSRLTRRVVQSLIIVFPSPPVLSSLPALPHSTIFPSLLLAPRSLSPTALIPSY